MKELEKENNVAAKNTGNFLFGIILYFLTAYIFKNCWNSGFASMFINLPKMNYGNSISILTLLFIVSKILGIGFGNRISEDEKLSDEITKTK